MTDEVTVGTTGVSITADTKQGTKFDTYTEGIFTAVGIVTDLLSYGADNVLIKQIDFDDWKNNKGSL